MRPSSQSTHQTEGHSGVSSLLSFISFLWWINRSNWEKLKLWLAAAAWLFLSDKEVGNDVKFVLIHGLKSTVVGEIPPLVLDIIIVLGGEDFSPLTFENKL